MEGRSVVPAFLFIVLFTTCSKSVILDSNELYVKNQQEPALVEQSNTVYTSSWETVSGWSKNTSGTTTTFTYRKNIPSLSEDKLVLVFARNLWPEDPELKELGDTEKPLMMPFYFLPFNEKPSYTEQWNYHTDGRQLEVSLRAKGGAGDVAQPGKRVQVRYIIIPQNTLKEKKQSAELVRKMSYDQIVKSFGLLS